MEILCFCAGIVFFYSQSFYPVLFLIAMLLLRVHWRAIIWFVFAVLWACVHQQWQADRNMPGERVLNNVVISGRIISIPSINPDKIQFQFQVAKLDNRFVTARILLSCYNRCPAFRIGQTWRFQAKLKKPVNLANPGGFDYVRFLKSKHIVWTGYIKNGRATLLDDPGRVGGLHNLRVRLSEILSNNISDGDASGIAQALTLGVTDPIDKSLWELFRRTGTTHLMVISGAHIALVAGVVFWLVNRLWRFSTRLCLLFPAQQIAGLASLGSALIYALLAGFGVPAQRALIACVFLLLPYLFSHRFSTWQGWRYALLMVLLCEPHAVLLPGFYFSFLAVAILILMNKRLTCRGLKKLILLQAACLFGLMPLTLYWFSYGAITGLIANLLAIPWVGYVIVPLAIVNLILLSLTQVTALVMPLVWAIKLLLSYLKYLDMFSFVNLQISLPHLVSVVALMMVMVLFLFLPVRALLPVMSVIAVAACYPNYPRPDNKEAWIYVLDVGQGLAVVVQTARHTLVYDTGVKFYHGSDMGKLAVIPFLKTMGVYRLDKVVISHPDLDHRGGLASIEEQYPISELIVDNTSFYHRGVTCHGYPDWQWDGVRFRFLAIRKKTGNKNNLSCVLQIVSDQNSLLLTGDIERPAEEYLLSVYSRQVQSSILIVPHHGSKTSSSRNFIRQVAPKYAVISAGFDNRYHFPHGQTLHTLREAGVSVLNTIDCGMVTIKMAQGYDKLIPSCYRTNHL
ncbi:DNA uptake/competence protein ComA [Legionella spiritensis]|uniref:DNA uptake/competence protein ComA n=1 Tax=Legionella spiritensis TaxID=452 RepID=A0A0W0Z404_LEGSP|nr:DNA uptake/competence protein ComA [Legionella spiritensis]SNV36182.1 DNA uptake/competence protein ComA [Legionella spiritensis]